MSLEERIVNLEVRAAFQDRLLAELDEVLREFSSRFEKLEALVRELKESADAPSEAPGNDPPPHY